MASRLCSHPLKPLIKTVTFLTKVGTWAGIPPFPPARTCAPHAPAYTCAPRALPFPPACTPHAPPFPPAHAGALLCLYPLLSLLCTPPFSPSHVHMSPSGAVPMS